jgi:hypothetical protein
MKGRNLFFVGLAVGLAVALLILRFNDSKPAKVKAKEGISSVKTILAKEINYNQLEKFDGELQPGKIEKLFFNIDGQLEKGDVVLVSGTRFKFNQLLCKLSIFEIFQELSKSKKSLRISSQAFLEELEKIIPAEKTKWQTFTEQVDPAKRLPDFPILNSAEERAIFQKTTIAKEYVRTLKMESEIEDCFLLAPFDGIVVNVFKKPGQKIRAKEPFVEIAKKGEYQIQFIVPYSEAKKLEGQKTIVVKDEIGKVIGNGKYLKSKTNLSDLSNNVVQFTFIPNQKGLYSFGKAVQTEIGHSIKCFVLPSENVKKNRVKVLKNGEISEREIQIIQITSESTYFTGLLENELVVVN